MDYQLLKVLHIIAVLIWTGGMLVVAVTLRSANADSEKQDPQFFAAVHRYDQRVTTPAMFGVWALGLTLAMMGGWFSEPWFLAKFALVFLLSGIHGTLSGNLRRLVAKPERTLPGALRHAVTGVIIFEVLIVLLVGLKPF
ncbi:CopD family protein [Agrobacterium sp.]|uniref:CopD family protein n=1 Tax=Agrobacterium sp. TaxID=361 RepID=UPI0028A622BF|nr:CopD family protein [Agrobacterium sp.]